MQNSPLKTLHQKKYDDQPRNDVLRLITRPPGRVLDVGCGAGATGAAIKRVYPQSQVTGIEINPEAARKARKKLDFVYTANIERNDLEHLGVRPNAFDLILCADVLEHLYDPWKVLCLLSEYLSADGIVIASIPNTQNIGIINNLLKGSWTYQNFGLLDATHIRFFTYESILKMFSGAGLHVSHCNASLIHPLEGDWPRDLDFGKFIVKRVSLEEAKALFTFQFFVVAGKAAPNPGHGDA